MFLLAGGFVRGSCDLSLSSDDLSSDAAKRSIGHGCAWPALLLAASCKNA